MKTTLIKSLLTILILNSTNPVAHAQDIDLGRQGDRIINNLIIRQGNAKDTLEGILRNIGINLVYINDEDSKKTNSLDLRLQNETTNNAINFILKSNKLQAVLVGKTMIVGTKIPDNLGTQTQENIKLKNISAVSASGILATYGAIAKIPQENRSVESTQIGSIETTTTKESIAIESIDNSKNESGDVPPLKGLTINVNPRSNTITLRGSDSKVKLALEIINEIDITREQVAINVKILDISLTNQENLGTSLSSRTGNDGFLSLDNGAALFNFGGTNPPSNTQVSIPATSVTQVQPINTLNNLPNQLLATIQAQVINGKGKILTDPTLVIQEGEKSSVKLTQEVFGGFSVNNSAGTGATISSRTPIIKEAGLSLDVFVHRIDSNKGSVELALSPEISNIGSTVRTTDGDIALVQKRKINSGKIQIKNGQTLILTGIIQESDRTSVSKVPILGDIPLLGALFSSTSKNNQRQEVVVLLTPKILKENGNNPHYQAPKL